MSSRRLGPLLLFSVCLPLYSCRQRADTEHVRVVPQVSPVQPRRVVFSPRDEERVLVVEKSGLVGVWDISSASKLELHASMAAGAIDACFAPDGRGVITVGLDGRVRWWTDGGKLLRTSAGSHTGPARAVAAAGDLVASAGEDRGIRLWKTDGSPFSEPLAGHAGAVVSLDISPRGDVVSVGADATVRLWKRASSNAAPGVYESSILYQESQPQVTPERYLHLVKYDVHWGWDHSVVFGQRGEVIAGVAFDGVLRLWKDDGAPRGVIPKAHERGQVRALAFSLAGDVFASGGFDGEVRLWNLDGSPHGEPVLAHGTGVSSVSFSSQGKRLATTGMDDRVRFWNREGALEVELPAGHEDGIFTVALSPQTTAVAMANKDGTVQVWDVTGHPRGKPLITQKYGALSLAFSPAGNSLAAGGSDGTLRLWSLDGAPQVEPMSARSGAILALAFSPGDGALAVGSQTLQLWNHAAPVWRYQLQGTDMISAIAFPPKGDFIATGSILGRIQVWNPDGSTRLPAFKLPKENLVSVAVSPDGDVFASAGGEESIVRLWNLDGSPRGAPLEGHLGTVRALAFSPAPPALLASGGDDGTVRLWHFPARESDVIDVGVPVNQLGFWQDLLWVRANGEWLFFYDRARKLVATMLIGPDGALTYTPDGWVSGSGQPMRSLRLFGEDGTALDAAQAAAHFSPDKIRAALEQ